MSRVTNPLDSDITSRSTISDRPKVGRDLIEYCQGRIMQLRNGINAQSNNSENDVHFKNGQIAAFKQILGRF